MATFEPSVQSSARRIEDSLWVRDESVPLIDHTVGSLLAERAGEYGDALALVGNVHGTSKERRLTYAELYDEACQVARALLGIAAPGYFVALWAPNVIEWPIIQYGSALAGVTLVALNPALRPDGLVYALNHSRSTVLIHADRSRDDDLAGIVASVRDECPNLRHVISLSAWDTFLKAGDNGRTLPELSADSPGMLQYTSGTTGNPKGVLLRHHSLVNVAKLTVERAELEHGAIGVNPLPMFHTAACVIATLGPLWLGGCTVLVEQFAPDSVLELIRRENAKVLFYVPTVLGAVLEAARNSSEPMPLLRTVMGGGASVPSVMIEATRRLFGVTVLNLFGQTELSPVLSMTCPGDSPDDLSRTVGAPLPQVDCKIVDSDSGDVQPLGGPGEICARGYQQLIEYLHDPTETARTVDSEGWVHTGDLGTMDERGMITVTGRLKDVIISGGENIAPAEVEACLLKHDAVLEVAVLGIPDERWGETVGAAVRVRGESSEGLPDALAAHCRERLESIKVPRHWYRVDALPATPTGKVQKFKLVDRAAEGKLEALQ